MTELTTYQPQSALTEQMDFARMVTTPGGQSILPDAYRGNPANVLIAVGLGQAMGLSPAESLYRIAVIKGKPTASAELIAANVRRAGHKLRVKVTENPPSATCTIIRADDPDEPTTVTRDMEWARGMGLATNDNYKKQPATMLSWRAISACARLACPEALYGVTYTPDEVESVEPAPAAKPQGKAALYEAVKVEPTPEPQETGEAPTEAQRRRMFALMGERRPDLTDRDDRLAFCSAIVGRDVASSNDLTAAEVRQISDTLDELPIPADTEPDDGFLPAGESA
jgi:hypothetical protein